MRYLQQKRVETKISLDLKNKKILSMLAENSRLPASYISRKVGLSRDAVSYRIRVLSEKGVIQGYKSVIDVGKFGYDAYHVFIQLREPSPEVETKIISKLKELFFIRAILKFSGKYDLELAIIARGLKEFEKHLGIVLSECSEHLNDYEIAAITKSYVQRTLPRSFLEEKEEKIPKPGSDEMPKLDEKDKKIIRIVSNNANLPLYSIAEKTGLSADAVNYRLKKLVQSGVITRFIIALNYAALSYDVYMILLSMPSISEENEPKLRQILKTDKNILWAVKTVGRYNLILYVCANDSDRLHETLTTLRVNFASEIKNYETLLAYEEHKYTYFAENMPL